MASSSSRKSSSSASKAPKPTFRRAGGASAKKGSSLGGTPASRSKRGASPVPRTAPKSKPISAYTAPTKRGSKPVLPKGGAASAAASVKSAKSKRVTSVKAPRATTVTVKAARSSAQPAKNPGKLPFRLPALGVKTVVPRKLSAGAAPAAGASPAPARSPKRNPLAAILSPIGALLSRLPLPHIRKGIVAAVAAGLVALAIVAVVVANSPLFAATQVTVNGSEHVPQATAQQLVKVPDGTTLFNVNERQVLEGLQANPWVMDVKVERTYPHGLTITPVERAVKAIAFITADNIAWAIGEDGAWIAPLSLSIAVDANGAEVQPAADGTLPEGAQQLSGLDAALAIAKRDGALLLTDVPSDVEPKAGETVDSDVVSAGLEYAKGFSPEFVAQIRDLSVASVEAISANLTSGVEVSLGEPEDITEKERVVTKLLSQEQGVTYINVREPGAYTFRSAPAA